MDNLYLYYTGFDQELDDVIFHLAIACDGQWKAMHYDHPLRLRELQFLFMNEDDEMGFMDEVTELGRGVKFSVEEQCKGCRGWLDYCVCPKADCGCIDGVCQCGIITIGRNHAVT